MNTKPTRTTLIHNLPNLRNPLIRLFFSSILPFFPPSTLLIILLACAIFVASSDAAVTIHVQDRAGNPLSPVRVQVFAGILEPDSKSKPIPPLQPREDGFVGFVTDKQGRVVVNLPSGQHTIVASPDLDSGQISDSFLIVREVNVPPSRGVLPPPVLKLSVADTIPVTVQAVGENDLGPLHAARVSFRPSQHTLGYVGLVKNNGQLQTAISPGRYHVVITGSIALHYVVLRDQVISTPPSTGGATPPLRVNFNGNVEPTAKLQLDLPANTSLALYEVLGTEISSEIVHIVENTIGYDAAYTASFALALDENAPPMRLTPGLTYQLSLSYVVDIDRKGTLYAYELRMNALQVTTPRTYRIGNNGAHPLKLTADTEVSEYRPGERVVVHYKILDTRGNQLFRFFNFSAARLVFPFVVVRDPDGVVVGSNPVTSELPEEFFRFAFHLPQTAQPGEYTVNVSLDAKLYGQLTDHFTFQVVAATDSAVPKISDISAPLTAEANTPLQIIAKIQEESSLSKVSLNLFDATSTQLRQTLIPTPQTENRYEWNLPGSIVGSEGSLRWQIVAIDAAQNQATKTGTITLQDTTPPTIKHTPIQEAELGVLLSMSTKVSDNVALASVTLSYKTGQPEEGDWEVIPAPLPSFPSSNFPLFQSFHFTIPASTLKASPLHYFLQATDTALNTQRLPKNGTFSVQLADKTPPQIHHVPVTVISPTSSGDSQPFSIEAVVIDNHQVVQVELSYRPIGEPQFTKLPMTRTHNRRVDSATYVAPIPSDSLMPRGAEYFLEANDANGNSARLPAELPRTYQIRPDHARIQTLSLSVVRRPQLQSSEANPIQIPVASETRFRLQAVDEGGQSVPVIPLWSATNGIGQTDQDGRFFAGIHAGRVGQVIATISTLDESSGLRGPAINSRPSQKIAARDAVAWIQLVPAPADRLIITPDSGEATLPLQLVAGTGQPFQAYVFDIFGNRRADAVTWRVEGGIGEMLEETFYASKVGRGRVLAKSAELQAAVEIDVNFGILAELEIEPKTLNMRAGERKSLSAYGRDTSGNRVPIAPVWSVRGVEGTLQNNTFVTGQSGDGEIVAGFGGIQAAASVRVSPSELISIHTSPFIAYLPTSTDKFEYTHQFVAEGWDIAGNPVPIRNLQWTIDAAIGTINQTGLVKSIRQRGTPTFGNVVINGAVWALGESAGQKPPIPGKSVVVIHSAPPGPIQHLKVTLNNFDQALENFTLAVGQSQKFEAVGVDENNQRVQVFPCWSVLGDIGIVQPDGRFIAMSLGIGTVVVTDSGHTAQMPITVTPGVLDVLSIYPAYATLQTGESRQFRLSGADALGNSIPISQYKPAWSTVGAGSPRPPVGFGSPNPPRSLIAETTPDGLVTAIHPGTTQIEAQIGDRVARAQLFVHPRTQNPRNPVIRDSSFKRPFIKVHPNPLEIEQGRTQQFHAFSVNPITSLPHPTVTGVSWHVTNGLGLIDAQGIFQAENVGEGRIIATFEGTSSSAYITVFSSHESNTLRSLIIVPQAEITLTVGDTQSFYTLSVLQRQDDLDHTTIRPTLASWRVSGGIGTIDAMGRFIAVTPGQGEVRANVDGVSVVSRVAVNPNSPVGAGSPSPPVPPIPEEQPSFGQNIGELVEFRVTPASLRIRAGDSVRFTAFGLDRVGNFNDVRPRWELRSDVNLGRIQPDGRFIANRVGTGRIIARLGVSTRKLSDLLSEPLTEADLPPQHISVEVIPNRPVFARLEPSELIVDSVAVSGIPLEFVLFDQRGNPVKLPVIGNNERYSVPTWNVVGSVGTVSPLSPATKAVFTPAAPASRDLIGEVIARIPNANLVGRARVFRYAMTDDIARARIEPDEIELPIGGSYRFQWKTEDAAARFVESEPIWEVNNTSTGAKINADGTLTIEDTASIGATLQVIGTVPNSPIRAVAQVRIVPSPLDRMVLQNITPVGDGFPGPYTPPVLKIGDSIRFRANGFDRHGNPIDLSLGNPPPLRWSMSPPTIGEILIHPGLETEVTITVRHAGNGTLQVNRGGLSATATVTVLPPPSTANLQITVVDSTAPITGTGTSTHPTVIKAGTTLSLIALNDGVVVQPIWTLTAAENLVGNNDRYSLLESQANIGQISSNGFLTVFSVGSGIITATNNGASRQIFINIIPGDLAMLQVEPSIAAILSDPRHPTESKSFSAEGVDLYGNQVPPDEYAPLQWSVTGGIGDISSSGVFVPSPVAAGTAITGTVVAASKGIYGSASVSVLAEIGTLATLELIPSSTVVAAGDSLLFQIIGRDEKGNLLPTIDVPIVMRQTPTVGLLIPPVRNNDRYSPHWTYRAPTKLPDESNRVVRFDAQTTEGEPLTSPEIEITLVPSMLAALRIEPSTTTIKAGNAQAFQLIITDTFGNSIQPKTLPAIPLWRLSEPLGELTHTTREGTTFEAQKVGTTHLSVQVGTVATSTQLQITPGALVSLKIAPESVTLAAGETVEFRLIGTDGHGNRAETVEATWQMVGFNDAENPLVPDQNGSDRRLWTPKKAGAGTIEVRWTHPQTGKTLTAQATVSVTPATLASLEIQPPTLIRPNRSVTQSVQQTTGDGSEGQPPSAPYRLISGGKYTVTAIGSDTFGNFIDVRVTWRLTGNLGRIETATEVDGSPRQNSATLEAIFVGEGNLIASVGEIQATEKVTVLPTTATIGPSGGRVESLSGAVIDFPANSINTPHRVGISIIASPGATPSAQQVTQVIDIQPRKLILKRPAQLTLSYADPITESFHPNRLSITFWDEFQEKWIQISSRVDLNQKTVIATVNHLAPYTVTASDKVIPRSDRLQVDGIRLNPPVFYAPETNRLTIEYLLNAPKTNLAEVTIEIFDFSDRRVHTLLSQEPRRIGRNAEQWDGQTNSGETVRNGRYVLVIIAKAGGETAVSRKLLIVFK